MRPVCRYKCVLRVCLFVLNLLFTRNKVFSKHMLKNCFDPYVYGKRKKRDDKHIHHSTDWLTMLKYRLHAHHKWYSLFDTKQYKFSSFVFIDYGIYKLSVSSSSRVCKIPISQFSLFVFFFGLPVPYYINWQLV